MEKSLIIYQSKYGATRKYADWLSERTGFDCAETKQANSDMLKGYDTIIYGGGIYASGIAGFSFIKKNIDLLTSKKLFVFCVGASPYDEAAYQEVKKHNFKNISADIPLFYYRGAWDENNMTFRDKNLCKMLHKAIAKKGPANYEPWMQALMGSVGQKSDWTDQSYLNPLLACLNP